LTTLKKTKMSNGFKMNMCAQSIVETLLLIPLRFNVFQNPRFNFFEILLQSKAQRHTSDW